MRLTLTLGSQAVLLYGNALLLGTGKVLISRKSSRGGRVLCALLGDIAYQRVLGTIAWEILLARVCFVVAIAA